MSEDKSSEAEKAKAKIFEAVKSIIVLLVSPTLTFIAATLALNVNKNNEAEKINLAKVEALTKFKADLTSDSQKDREYAYEALSALGFGKLADKMRIQSLSPDRIRVYVKNEQQKSAIHPAAEALRVPRSAIYVASKTTKFPDNAEVRYFDVKDWMTAHRIATLFGQSVTVQPGSSNIDARGAIEVWLPPTYQVPIWDIYTYSSGNNVPAGLLASIFCK